MQGFRERQTIAQTQENTDLRPLSKAISDLEWPLSDLEAWGLLIQALGTVPNTFDPSILYVVGKAVSQTAGAAYADWDRCRALVHTEAAR